MNRTVIALCILLCCSIALIITFDNLPVKMEPAAAAAASSIAKASTSKSIYEIPLPAGYKRMQMEEGSFGKWLQQIKLRNNNTVYLYNGNPKPDQTLHYAVLDLSTGNKDLQQCADAIMRLKAEYYFSKNEFDSISFPSANKTFNFQQWLNKSNTAQKDQHVLLLQFMEKVFINCGTYTVDEMTKPINMQSIQPGDVFVKAGSPG